jgi:hypothetical protein
MGTTYTKAKTDVKEMIATVMDKYHPDIASAGVTVVCLMALAEVDEDGYPKGHAVSDGGYPCAAKIRIVNLKDRAKGIADAELVIDEREWAELPQRTKIALLDHELEHLKLVIKGGDVMKDDCRRPLLKINKHDRTHGWFDVIARRHGEHSIEVRQAKELVASTEQLYFPFAAEPELVSGKDVIEMARRGAKEKTPA